jgi:hypothetical protein
MTDAYFDSEAEFRKAAEDIAPSRTLTDAEKAAAAELVHKATLERYAADLRNEDPAQRLARQQQEMQNMTPFVQKATTCRALPRIYMSTYMEVVPRSDDDLTD